MPRNGQQTLRILKIKADPDCEADIFIPLGVFHSAQDLIGVTPFNVGTLDGLCFADIIFLKRMLKCSRMVLL